MASRNNASREQAAMQKLFEQRAYVGGRLPDILNPPSQEAPPPSPQELGPTTWEPVIPAPDGERPKRRARNEKATGLHIILHAIQRDGFPHPMEQGSFLMLPKVIS